MRDLLTTSRTFALILALGLLAMASRNLTDPDFWWHLKTGQLIAQNHQVFHSDPFSSTRQGQPWINHEWLSDLLIYGVYLAAGLPGLMVAFAAVIAAGFMVLYGRSPGKPYAAGICTLLGAFASLPSWGVRPQMLAFLLASVVLLLLERSEPRPRMIWWIVPLMLLWVNLHASFPVGIVLVAAFLAAESAEAWLRDNWVAACARVKRLGGVLLLSIAVVPLNPYGFHLFAYPFQTLSSGAMQEFIAEWASPDFHRTEYVFLLLMLLSLLAGSALGSVRLRLRDLVLLVPATLGALISARHIYFFVLIAVPVLARSGAQLFEGRSVPARRPRPMVNAVLLAGLVLFLIVRIRHVVRVQDAAEQVHFPRKLVQFVKANPLPAGTLNYYNWGGYMIWALYPQSKVFVDGRADVYGDAFLNQYAHAYYLTDNWAEILDRYRVQAVILPPDAPLITGLKSIRQWHVVYADEQATVVAKQ